MRSGKRHVVHSKYVSKFGHTTRRGHIAEQAISAFDKRFLPCCAVPYHPQHVGITETGLSGCNALTVLKAILQSYGQGDRQELK